MSAVPSWGAVLARVRNILREVTQIENVYDSVPRVLTGAKLPVAIVYPLKLARQRNNTANSVQERRGIEIWVYVANARQGSEGQSEETAINYDMESLVAQQFDSRPRLGLNDNGVVNRAVLVGSDGLEILPYPLIDPKEAYFGYVLTLEVERLFGAEQREFDDG